MDIFDDVPSAFLKICITMNNIWMQLKLDVQKLQIIQTSKSKLLDESC